AREHLSRKAARDVLRIEPDERGEPEHLLLSNDVARLDVDLERGREMRERLVALALERAEDPGRDARIRLAARAPLLAVHRERLRERALGVGEPARRRE